MATTTSKQRPSAMHIFALGLNFLAVTAQQKITQGPLAPVTIGAEKAYSSGRACAAKCLVYRGDLPCGLAGYQDLAINLGCGCYSSNVCFCSTAYKTSATSYMSACISANCARSVNDWTNDVNSMLGIYDSYCKTANVEISSASFVPSALTTGGAGAVSTTASVAATARSGSDGSSVARTSAAPGSTSTSDPSSSDRGLSATAILGLAVGLGVGIPLLIAIAAGAFCCVWLKKRKDKKAAQRQLAPEVVQHPTPLTTTHTGTTAFSTEKMTPVAGWTPASGRQELDPRHQYGDTTGTTTPVTTAWTPSPPPEQGRHEAHGIQRFEVPGQPTNRQELS
jgi:hypothetical protein